MVPYNDPPIVMTSEPSYSLLGFEAVLFEDTTPLEAI